MGDHYVVTTAAPDQEAARRMARSAVRASLAGSAQVIGPVVSVFWHLGEPGEGEEWVVAFKTTSDRYPELEAHLIAEHPWENPEVTAVKIEVGSAGYLAWLEQATGPEQAG